MGSKWVCWKHQCNDGSIEPLARQLHPIWEWTHLLLLSYDCNWKHQECGGANFNLIWNWNCCECHKCEQHYLHHDNRVNCRHRLSQSHYISHNVPSGVAEVLGTHIFSENRPRTYSESWTVDIGISKDCPDWRQPVITVWVRWQWRGIAEKC